MLIIQPECPWMKVAVLFLLFGIQEQRMVGRKIIDLVFNRHDLQQKINVMNPLSQLYLYLYYYIPI